MRFSSRPLRFAKAIEIAARYRHLLPRGRSLLLYGTKNARRIIRDDRIAPPQYPTISLTRSLHVAVHFAMLERDFEETRGAILILERELLRTRHTLLPYNYPGFDEPSAREAEERVEAAAIGDLKRYLLGVIWLRKDEAYPGYFARRKYAAKIIRAKARKRGLNAHTVQSRIRRGWPLKRALSEPVRSGGSPWSRKRHAAYRRKVLAMKRSITVSAVRV
jgi:hypothetical protein